ncbi:MAG: NADH-quinone oxidoreductase subunit A [Thermodesulfobacteriota bacterium]
MLLDYLPILIMMAFVGLVTSMIIMISSLVRPSKPSPRKNQVYECGVNPVGEAGFGKVRVHYFIIAILFSIFEVETLYLFPWATVLKKVGLVGYIEMFIFIFLLLVGLVYAWGKGALDWVS